MVRGWKVIISKEAIDMIICATDLDARTFLPQPRCGELVDHADAGAVLRESKSAYQTRWTAADLEKDVGEQLHTSPPSGLELTINTSV